MFNTMHGSYNIKTQRDLSIYSDLFLSLQLDQLFCTSCYSDWST